MLAGRNIPLKAIKGYEKAENCILSLLPIFSRWVPLSNLMMSEYFNLNNFDPDLLDTAKIKHFVCLMKQKYISYWQQALQRSQKLEFYKIFESEYAPSNCPELSTRTSERRALTKLRVSNHKRMIELGRYNQIS